MISIKINRYWAGSVLLLLSACSSKKEENSVFDKKQGQITYAQDRKWADYKDPYYPIDIGFVPDPKKMEVSATILDEKDPIVTRLEIAPGYSVGVDADFSEADGNLETLERAYTVTIYKYEKDFRKAMRFSYREPIKQENYLNGAPSILVANSTMKHEDNVLIIPNVYAVVYLSGFPTSEKITREALKHFRWTQPIDTTTPEFKAWKAHIWEILKSSPTPPQPSKR